MISIGLYFLFFIRFEYFGVQFYGECWGGPNAGKTYARDGTSKKCWNGVGKQETNAVYRLEDMPGMILTIYDFAFELNQSH